MNDDKRLTKEEFDILDIFMKYHPEPINATIIALEMREKGYDITEDELNKILEEVFDDEYNTKKNI